MKHHAPHFIEKDFRLWARHILNDPKKKVTDWYVVRGPHLSVYQWEGDRDLYIALPTEKFRKFLDDEGDEMQENYSFMDFHFTLESAFKNAQENRGLRGMTWSDFYNKNNLHRVEEGSFSDYPTLKELRQLDAEYFSQFRRPMTVDVVVEDDTDEYQDYPTGWVYDRTDGEWVESMPYYDNADIILNPRHAGRRGSMVSVSSRPRKLFYAQVTFNFKTWKYTLSGIKPVKQFPKIK